jgi:hypothetical protein
MKRADDSLVCDTGKAGVVGVRPLAATRVGVPPPACGGEWRK